jgi:hypothetical protein
MNEIIFITQGGINWASSRIRAYWPAQYMGADVKTLSEAKDTDLSKYRAVIWQKTGDPVAMRQLKAAGVVQFLDICDPLHWFSPKETAEICEAVNGVVCSTQALLNDFANWIGSSDGLHHIPDRINLDHYPIKRQHVDTQPARLIWYGLHANRSGLAGALPVIERAAANGYKVELTIFDDRPDQVLKISERVPVYHALWELSRENATIAAHDVALVPPYPGPWGVLKSNNKTLTALACGLPATTGYDYYQLTSLVGSGAFRAEIAGRMVAMEDQHSFDVERSAAQWLEVLNVY